MTFGARLKNYRKSLHISQESLAEKVGVSRQAVTKWESDQSLPSSENLITLAGIFNVSLDQLVNGEESGQKEPNKILQANLTRIAIMCQTIAGSTCIAPNDITPDPAWNRGYVLFKLGILLLCSAWMVRNLFYEKDVVQRKKNNLIELVYCMIQAANVLLGYYIGPRFLWTVMLLVVCLTYILYINPKYMNRVLVRTKKK